MNRRRIVLLFGIVSLCGLLIYIGFYVPLFTSYDGVCRRLRSDKAYGCNTYFADGELVRFKVFVSVIPYPGCDNGKVFICLPSGACAVIKGWFKVEGLADRWFSEKIKGIKSEREFMAGGEIRDMRGALVPIVRISSGRSTS